MADQHLDDAVDDPVQEQTRAEFGHFGQPMPSGANSYGLESNVPNFIANHGFLPPGRSLPRMTGDHCGILP